MPPHILTLVGTLTILLHNIDNNNGTRLSVKTLVPNVIEPTIITRYAKGEDVVIPRITLIPSDMPFNFKRLQFPIRVAFVMPINKVQGQSLMVSRISLENACFSHGQLNVACSRAVSYTHLDVYKRQQLVNRLREHTKLH